MQKNSLYSFGNHHAASYVTKTTFFYFYGVHNDFQNVRRSRCFSPYYNHCVTNDIVRSLVKRQWTLVDTIRQTKLQLFGHICRMSDDRLLKALVLGMVEGEDDQNDLHGGGLTKTWCDVTKKHQSSSDDDRGHWQLEKIHVSLPAPTVLVTTGIRRRRRKR